MKIQEFLEIKLFEINDYKITVGSILVSIAILIATKIIVMIIKRLIVRQSVVKKMDLGRSNSIFQIIKYLIWVFAIALVLQTNGINLTLLVAGSAALLVGLGFGLQHFFNDLLSGIILLFEGTIKVNDIVEMENQIVGKVIEIGLRTSKLLTRDNIIMIIPNSSLVNDRVINWSHNEDKTRFHVNVGVAYGSDVSLVTKVLLFCADKQQDVAKEPKPFVRFLDFGDSSLDFQLFFWSHRIFEIENIKSEIRYRIDEEFRKNSIHIPFPQRDLHIKSKL